jgi:hypothetical protein
MQSTLDSSIDPQAFHMWRLTKKNNIERKWKCEPVTEPLMQNLNVFDSEKMPPYYVEI